MDLITRPFRYYFSWRIGATGTHVTHMNKDRVVANVAKIFPKLCGIIAHRYLEYRWKFRPVIFQWPRIIFTLHNGHPFSYLSTYSFHTSLIFFFFMLIFSLPIEIQ